MRFRHWNVNPLAPTKSAEMDVSDTKSAKSSSTINDIVMDLELPPPYIQQSSTTIQQRQMKEVSISFEKGEKVEGSLTLFFDAHLSTDRPVLIEGSSLKGNFRLKLDHPDSIKSVTFGVNGEYLLGGVTGTEENYLFLKDEHCLWSTSDGEPHPSLTDSTPVSGSTFKGSLHGEYTWPISVELPKEVTVKMKKGSASFTLPQSFEERFIRATIRYTVWIKVAQHGFLAVDQTLSMPFAYLRVTRPPPLSSLRQVAYEEGTPLLGPSDYPDGWHTEGPVQIEGTLSKTVSFGAQCTLYLAKPLSYTAGNVISLFLRIESDNEQALDLLATPKAIHVRVRRHTVDHIHHESIVDNSSIRDCLDYSQRAVWWVADEQPSSNRVRLLSGELHLKPGMMPNTELGYFKMRYSVMLYGFDAVALHFEEKKFLQEAPIEICTFYGPGLHPKAITPHNTEPDVGYGKLIVPYMNEYSKGFY